MTRFHGKTILITGAASGIGRATAVRVAQEGATLVLIGRNIGRLNEVKQSLRENPHLIYECDTTDENAIVAFCASLRAQGMILNGVVHCAGIHWLRPLQLTDSQSMQEMLNSHVVSSVALTRAVITSKLASKEGCSIVWISSVAAFQGGAGTVAYSAAKGGMISAARVLAVELARRKARVNVIAPGVVRTPQSDAFLSQLTPEQIQAVEDRHLLGFGNPEDIAGVVAFLLSSDARWITGTTLIVDGGLTAH